MKKIIAVALMLALSLTMCISVSAEEVTSIDKVAYLISQGIPEDLIMHISTDEIDIMYNSYYGRSIEFLGQETTTMHDTSSAMVYGTIPSSDMKFSWSNSALGNCLSIHGNKHKRQ